MADSGQDSDQAACEQLQGGGCSWLEDTAGPSLVCTAEVAINGDSGPPEAVVQSGSCGCGANTSPSLLSVMLLCFALVRRRAALLLLLMALSPMTQAGVDAQMVAPLDGGTWPVLREAKAGQPWSGAVALSHTYARDLVVLVDNNGELPLLSQAVTRELGVSYLLGQKLRVGAGVPIHRWIEWEGSLDTRNYLGDITIWTLIPMRDPEGEGLHIGFYTQTEFSTGPHQVYLGDPSGAVAGTLAVEAPLFGPLEMAANLGARLAPEQQLPGLRWGRRLEYGVGLRSHIWGPVGLTGELIGSTPLPPKSEHWSTPAHFPLELVGTANIALPQEFVLSVGGGSGITRGLGSPTLRTLVMLDRRPRDEPDRDQDGVPDTADVCPEQPEDRDGWKDRDGCPEPDNDNDGIYDDVDTCPLRPEVYNQHRDSDGCPDHVTLVRLSVSSEEPELLEQVTLSVGDLVEQGLFPGEVLELRLTPAEYSLRVQAEGHHPIDLRIDVPKQERWEHPVLLAPIRYGELQLSAVGEQAQPLAGWVRLQGAPRSFDASGGSFTLLAGEQQVVVSAAGYRAREVQVHIPPGAPAQLQVELEPSMIHLEAQRIVLEDRIHFEQDSATLSDASLPMLNEMATLMLDTQSILLLRIEGHTDETGDSLYNLELSHARAEAVRDHLISQGIEAQRLQALGTGEARLLGGAAGSRRVEFTVLVWDDERRAVPLLETQRGLFKENAPSMDDTTEIPPL